MGPLSSGKIATVSVAPFKIRPGQKVAVVGGDLAHRIGPHLKSAGLTVLVMAPVPPVATVTPLEYGTRIERQDDITSMRHLLQLFRRAYGILQPTENAWPVASGFIDPFRPTAHPGGFGTMAEFETDRAGYFASVRAAFEALDILVFTHGDTEVWECVDDGVVLPYCPGVRGGVFNPLRHRMRNFTVGEVVSDSLEFIDLLRSVNPSARLVLNISPVPLTATARADTHILAAALYSKSVLRVACEEVTRLREGVSYLPSYELMAGPQAPEAILTDDHQSVSQAGVFHIADIFVKMFVDPTRDAPDEEPSPSVTIPAKNPDPEGQGPVGEAGCNLCGNREFKPGPGGRMAPNGKAPRCGQCGSLERNRAVAAILRNLPPGTLAQRSALLVGADQGADSNWFTNATLLPWPAGSPVITQLDELADSTFDFISAIHTLEFIADDRQFFDRLIGLLSPMGVLMIRFMEPERRETTMMQDAGEGRPLRLYGNDLVEHFKCQQSDIAALPVVGRDPHTGQTFVVHCFARSPECLMLFGLSDGEPT